VSPLLSKITSHLIFEPFFYLLSVECHLKTEELTENGSDFAVTEMLVKTNRWKTFLILLASFEAKKESRNPYI